MIATAAATSTTSIPSLLETASHQAMAKSPSISTTLDSGFDTVSRERNAIHPSDNDSDQTLLSKLITPHIHSFNSIVEDGLLENAVKHLEMQVIHDEHGNKLSFWLEDVQLAKPMLLDKEQHSVNRFMLPSECRQRGLTYQGALSGKICYQVNSDPFKIIHRHLGNTPIMLKSNRCHLEGASSRRLIELHEESNEFGGYFIINGIEKLIRLLIVTRRNHVLGLVRPSYTKRGQEYSNMGVMMRCVRDDQTSHTITLHYLTDGNVTVRFSYRKQEFLIPFLLILKALKDTNDREIYEALTQDSTDASATATATTTSNNSKSDTFLTTRVENMLREFKSYRLFTKSQCLAFLGSKFSAALRNDDELTDEQLGTLLLRKVILVHLESGVDKFNMLVFMVQKLYALAGGKCSPDSPDSPMYHELLLSGHLYVSYVKEKLDEMLTSIRLMVLMDKNRNKTSLASVDEKYMKKILSKSQTDVGKKLQYFLATGNMPSMTGMDLQQTSGYTVLAERLNFYRYLSHFRSVHRGAFFSELKTTSVRKLLPEAWGFLCPVHTPDGAPCGLLNHLSHTCIVVTDPFVDVTTIPSLLASLGVTLYSSYQKSVVMPSTRLTVQLNGTLIGSIDPAEASSLVAELRRLKCIGKLLPRELEIAWIPASHSAGGPFPGLFLFTTPSRLMRPVRALSTGTTEYIGTLEQVFLDIAVTPEEVILPETTHVEIAPTHMLSVIANLTPFSDFNQSPRNMYQCQMSKQTMGTPVHAFAYRSDSKLYRLQSGQTPVVRPRRLHSRLGFDGYPNGTNAVVAVISYTGYDMEDAMILNKSSFERGFGVGTVYKTEVVDLADKEKREEIGTLHFECTDADILASGALQTDGLPPVGTHFFPGDPLASSVDERTGACFVYRYKGFEDAYLEHVRLLGDDTGSASARKVSFTFRFYRPPVIGDKFSSRHGQKGICSQKWPLVDMPFSESGLTPDIIINPHAFPSRMTIGMLLESMAGKSGALHGQCQDATPFQFPSYDVVSTTLTLTNPNPPTNPPTNPTNPNLPPTNSTTEEEKNPSSRDSAVDTFGKELLAAGYNYYGNEPMYSGIFGGELSADIYIGVVYYQRLRHMVHDKFQVRTSGPIHTLTHQPIQGRKRAGGIRFGEMERDSLLAHGTAFLLQDRLLNCSDYTQMYLCEKCGGICSVVSLPVSIHHHSSTSPFCRECQSSDSVTVVALPYVFRYLSTELLSMNIRLQIHLQS